MVESMRGLALHGDDERAGIYIEVRSVLYAVQQPNHTQTIAAHE